VEKIIERDRPYDNVIRRMHLARRIARPRIKTLIQYLILTSFSRQEWLRERPSVLRYNTFFTSCYLSTRLHNIRNGKIAMVTLYFWATNSVNVMWLLTNMVGVFVVKAKGVVKKLAGSGWNQPPYIDEGETVNFLRISITQGCF
jgi:hypothetical protein